MHVNLNATDCLILHKLLLSYFEYMTFRISLRYVSSLDYSPQKRYFGKLTFDGKVLPDPYGISEDQWLGDVSKWPSLDFGDLYVYLVDKKRTFTKEKLKVYKWLEAYNYFYNGYIHTVYYHECTSWPFVFLRSRVNSSQKQADENPEVWVILSKETTSVKAAHCKLWLDELLRLQVVIHDWLFFWYENNKTV